MFPRISVMLGAGVMLCARASLFSQTSFDFRNSTAGFTTTASGGEGNAWVYGPKSGVDGAGAWYLNEPEKRTAESYSSLISPTLTVSGAEPVVLTFNHLYSFADKGTPYDGGQIQISINGEAFRPLPSEAFTANGYNGIIVGQNVLQKESGFTGISNGFDKPSYLTSSANLGSFFAGTTFRFQFIGAWDESLVGGSGGTPNWMVSDITVYNAVVPEPALYAGTFGLAILGWTLARRWRQRPLRGPN